MLDGGPRTRWRDGLGGGDAGYGNRDAVLLAANENRWRNVCSPYADIPRSLAHSPLLISLDSERERTWVLIFSGRRTSCPSTDASCGAKRRAPFINLLFSCAAAKYSHTSRKAFFQIYLYMCICIHVYDACVAKNRYIRRVVCWFNIETLSRNLWGLFWGATFHCYNAIFACLVMVRPLF